MGTYHLGAQPPRWVRSRRAQDGQLGAGYVHRIFVAPSPPPSPSLNICARTAANVSHKPGVWPQVMTIYLRLYT